MLKVDRKKIVSMHPIIKGDEFYWDRGVWDKDLFGSLQKAAAIILPQTVERELYYLCKKLCPQVFPNYDLRFLWEGKIGDTFAFWTYGVKYPHTLVFPRVETLLGDHSQMDHPVPELLQYPFVMKGAHAGEGRQVWLIENESELEEKLQILLHLELEGIRGFVIQEYLPALDKDLRVVVVGDQVHSYWRKARTFLHNVVQGGEIDSASDKELQEVGRGKVWEFCRRSGINLAAFDLVFPAADDEPFFLEINYTFGRTGLGGSERFYTLLHDAVNQWLQANL